MTRPIVFSSFSAGSPTLSVRPCFSLSSTSSRDVAELARHGRCSRRTSGRPRSAASGCARRTRRRRPGVPSADAQLLEGRQAHGLLGLDHDHRRPGLGGHRVRHRAEQVAAVRRSVRRLGRCAHHHQVVVRRLADDRRPDRCRLAQDAAHPSRAAVLARRSGRAPACSRWQRALADALRHHVQHHHLRAEALARGRAPGASPARRAGPPRTGTRIERTSSTPRCLTTAMSHGDSRTTASMVGEKTARPRRAAHRVPPRPCAAAARRRRAAPAEDDQVGALLPDRLDHAIGRAPADADHGPDLDALLVAEVQHALQQAARGARLRRALGQRDALGHLDDAERGDLGRRGRR